RPGHSFIGRMGPVSGAYLNQRFRLWFPLRTHGWREVKAGSEVKTNVPVGFHYEHDAHYKGYERSRAPNISI
ncbi:MAG: hypothetical protein AAEJ43_10705, partial [Gammaproteobacteria bacterium]